MDLERSFASLDAEVSVRHWLVLSHPPTVHQLADNGFPQMLIDGTQKREVVVFPATFTDKSKVSPWFK